MITIELARLILNGAMDMGIDVSLFYRGNIL